MMAKTANIKIGDVEQLGKAEIAYQGAEGKVFLLKNERTKKWIIRCHPQGSRRHFTAELEATKKPEAIREAKFFLINDAQKALGKRPSREEAMEAVRTLIAYTGDNPNREGRAVSFAHTTNFSPGITCRPRMCSRPECGPEHGN